MESSRGNDIAVALEAVLDAEESLAELPQSAAVRALYRRALALKNVLYGVVCDVPRLSDEQRARLVSGAAALTKEVTVVRLEVE